MTKKYDGGPAFARTGGAHENPVSGPVAQQGMSLRDYFAAKAMTGLLTMPTEWRGYFGKDGSGSTFKIEAAKAAYELADAMLEARK